MAAPAAVIRSYRGYFLWLALQYVAFLTVGNDDFFLEQWPVLVLVAIWLISELVAKFSWKLSKRSSGPLARGLEIFYVLAGVGFQKALLASRVVSHPTERVVSQAIAGASKLSFTFFFLPAGEFVLLLLVDSLLQLLLFSQPTSSQQDLSCDVSLVLLMDALFTALPLLLYRFGPWGALDNPPTTNSQGDEGRQAMKHEDAYFSRGPSATAVAPPYTSWMGVRCRCCGRGFLNLPYSNEAHGCPHLDLNGTPTGGNTECAYVVRGRDGAHCGAETPVERLLVSLFVLLLKRSDGSSREHDTLFDGAVTMPEVESLRREIRRYSRRYMSGDKEGADTSSPGLTADTGGSCASELHPYPCGRCPLPRQEGPITTVSPGQRTATLREERGSTASRVCPALTVTSAAPQLQQLPPQHIHTPRAAGSQLPESRGSTQQLDLTGSSPPLTSKAQSDKCCRIVLDCLRGTYSKVTQDGKRPIGVGRAAVPTVPAEVRPSRAAATPVSVTKSRASSQPPPDKAIHESVLLGSMLAPPTGQTAHLLGEAPVSGEDSNNSRRHSVIEGNSCNPLKMEMFPVNTIHKPKLKNTDLIILSGIRRDAMRREALRASLASGSTGPNLLVDQPIPPHKDGAISSSSRQPNDSQYVSRPLAGTVNLGEDGHNTQQLSSGPARDDALHHTNDKQEYHPVQRQKQQPVLPTPKKDIGSGERKDRRGRSPPWISLFKVLRPPADQNVHVVLRPATPPEELAGGAFPAACNDPNKQMFSPKMGVSSAHVGGGTSPVQAFPILGPLGGLGQQHQPVSHSVLWGRSKAIGANGTPMLSPRRNGRTGSLGARGTADDVRYRSQSALLLGPERQCQWSPRAPITTINGDGSLGGVWGEAEGLVDREECIQTGYKHPLGTPTAVPSTKPTTQRRTVSSKEDDSQRILNDFAMWRRGRCMDTSGPEYAEPKRPQQLSPTRRLGGPGVSTKEDKNRGHTKKGTQSSASRDASTPHAENIVDELGKRLAAATPRASRTQSPSPFTLGPAMGSDQLPLLPPSSSSRLSSSARNIAPKAPPEVKPTDTSQHSQAHSPEQLLEFDSNNTSSSNSWDSWEPLLPGGSTALVLPVLHEVATRLGDESHGGGEEGAGTDAHLRSPSREPVK